MPTYENNGTEAQHVDNIKGYRVTVAPGETVETYKYYILPDFDKTADAPYWNPVLAITNVLSGSPAEDQTVVLDTETRWIKIWLISNVILEVYLQDKTLNPPAFAILGQGDQMVMKIDRRAEKLIFVFSLPASSCQLIESAEEIQ